MTNKTSSKLPAGWLHPYVETIDRQMGHFRWTYWTNVIAARKVVSLIPPIEFRGITFQDAEFKAFNSWFDAAEKLGHSRALLLDWLLYSLGDPIFAPAGTECWPANIPEKLHRWWYSNVDLGMLMRRPGDYFGLISTALIGKGGGHFPTPVEVCNLMNKMVCDASGFDGSELEHCQKTIHDPCVGTGAMLLDASNRTLRISGVDISLEILKCAHITAHLFVPWMLPWPVEIEGFYAWPRNDIFSPVIPLAWGNSLTMESFYKTRGLPVIGKLPPPDRPVFTDAEMKELSKDREQRWGGWFQQHGSRIMRVLDEGYKPRFPTPAVSIEFKPSTRKRKFKRFVKKH